MQDKKQNNPPRGRKHIGIEERSVIADRIANGDSFRKIASRLGLSVSTVSREVQKRSKLVESTKNDCLSRDRCRISKLCTTSCTRKRCAVCRQKDCRSVCPDYVKTYCDKAQQPPYVCNTCEEQNTCVYDKMFYDPSYADQDYKQTLTDRRKGFDLTEQEIEEIDKMVYPLIKKGLAPYHIVTILGDDLPVSESTLRRMIDSGVFTARNIDLRNQVKRKPRNSQTRKMKQETTSDLKEGRLYSDFLAFMEEHDSPVVEMDCVEGKKREPATLLTLYFRSVHLQLAIIMDAHTGAEVVKALDKIETALGAELFADMFPVILTDNGHEFLNIEGMERSCFDAEQKRTHIFFCDPNRPDQKGSCENNHRMIRYIIPKGSSLMPYGQDDVNLMMNHINSYTRKALFGRSPYELAQNAFPEDFFILLGIEQIPADEINLTPSLLKKAVKTEK